MDFRITAVPPDLAPWVAAGVEISLHSAAPGPLALHLPALVEGGLTVVLEGQLYASTGGGLAALPAGLVSGPNPQPHLLYRSARLRSVGLRLHPAGLAALLGDSPAMLPVPAAAGDIWGLPWQHGLEQLHQARGSNERMAVLFGFVRRWLGRHERHRHRTRQAWQLQGAALDLARAGAQLGLTHRQFERRFQATFGLRPKLFQRIARLEGLLRAAIPSGRTDALLALEHGYYDQSHLARELRLLAGAPLTTLVQAVRANDGRHELLAVGVHARNRASSQGTSFFS